MAASIALKEFRKMTARKTSQRHLSAAMHMLYLKQTTFSSAAFATHQRCSRRSLPSTAGLLNDGCIGDALATLSLQMCCKRAALIASRCFSAAGSMSRDARGFTKRR